MNRRELMAGAGALALAGCGPASPAGEGPPVAAAGDDVLSGVRLMADVETYVGFGTHRTGSPGDLATSDWFANHWRELGYEIEQTAKPTSSGWPNPALRVPMIWRLRCGARASTAIL